MSEPVIDLLAEEWAGIDELGATLSEQDWMTPTDLPGWCARDALSHIIGTERMLAGDPAPDIDITHLDYVRDAFAGSMEVWVEERRNRSGSEVLAEFRDVTSRRLTQLRAMSEDDLSRPGWSPIGEVPYRDFMVVRLFDCWMHEQDIRRAVDRPGHTDGAIVEAVLSRFRAALGFIVGKKAGAPEGSSVTFTLEGGPPGLTYGVLVEGRARVVDEPVASPTVTIAIPFTSFVALGGGRWTRERAEHEGGVELSGDVDLAGRILDNMAFTP